MQPTSRPAVAASRSPRIGRTSPVTGGVGFFFIMGLILLPGCASVSKPTQHGIPNFGVVAPGIYRGGQPTAEGWRWLAASGVTTSIKLNEERYDPEQPALDAGLCVVRLPIDMWQQTLREPALAKLRRAVALMDSGEKVYVHCRLGMDRTGLTVYLYRLRHGWPIDKARAEAFDYGFHKELNGLWRIMSPNQPLRSPKDQ